MTEEEPSITTIQLYSDTKAELEDLKRGSDTYDHVIRRLIEESGNE
jgi:predicted CopG family antitoxin